MSIEADLRKIAQEIVVDIQAQAAQLERQYSEAQERAFALKAQAHAKSNEARLAPKRLDNYPVLFGGNYNCPRCWIERIESSTLIPTQEANGKEGLKCRKCGHILTR